MELVGTFLAAPETWACPNGLDRAAVAEPAVRAGRALQRLDGKIKVQGTDALAGGARAFAKSCRAFPMNSRAFFTGLAVPGIFFLGPNAALFTPLALRAPAPARCTRALSIYQRTPNRTHAILD